MGLSLLNTVLSWPGTLTLSSDYVFYTTRGQSLQNAFSAEVLDNNPQHKAANYLHTECKSVHQKSCWGKKEEVMK